MEDNLNYELIGKRVKERRLKLHLTQEKIAEKIGACEQHISKIENAESKMSLNCLVLLANALETTVDYFLMDNVKSGSAPYLLGEAQIIFDDCTPEEIYIITELAKTLKKSLRTKKLQPAE